MRVVDVNPMDQSVALFIHVPHASTVIPSDALTDFVVPPGELAPHIALQTDHFTDELFSMEGPDITTVLHGVSRFVVDPERFEHDDREPMAARGQGVLYEKGMDGTCIRPRLPADRRDTLLDRWYRPHHRRLAAAVDAGLRAHGRVLIVDAHSFPNKPLLCELNQRTPRPDLCIGIAGIHTPEGLVFAAQDWCRAHGWSSGVDWPYAGSIVPLEHLARNTAVMSVMIEVNRDRYMALDGNQPIRSHEFEAVRRGITDLVQQLRVAASQS